MRTAFWQPRRSPTARPARSRSKTDRTRPAAQGSLVCCYRKTIGEAMAFVITQNCCTDASCVPVCPVDCIRPVPGDSGASASMLYIDPTSCVDCGACVAVCPVGAIYHEDELPESQSRFKTIN